MYPDIRMCLNGAVLACAISAAASANDLVRLATDAGITPESLTMAGFTAADVSIIITRIDDATTEVNAVNGAATSADSYAATITTLREDLQDAPGDDQMMSDLVVAEGNLAAANGSFASNCVALRDTALDGYLAAAQQKIATTYAAHAYRVPPEFRANTRTHEQWKAIEQALRAERRALADEDEELDDADATLLANVRAETEVVAAKLLLETNLTLIQAAFDTATSGE